MAKSDSFFIRGKTFAAGGSYAETEIDIGHVVDALGKTVMRIHNLSCQTYQVSLTTDWSIPANTAAHIRYQLTTQPQTALVDATDRSVIASGSLNMANGTGTANTVTFLSHDADILPQDWTNGYLVGVEQLYLGIYVDSQLSEGNVVAVMECTSETLSASAAMSLALSQQ